MNGARWRFSAKRAVFNTDAPVSRFIFDVSTPVTDTGGDIDLGKADGLVASWAGRSPS